MEWVEYHQLARMQAVPDMDALPHVMNTPELTEFIYRVQEDKWIVSIR